MSAYMKVLASKISDIRSNEWSATVLSFLMIFILMASYYILRPVRDALASDWTDVEISTLWTLNFFVGLAAVVIYGSIVSRIKFKFLVPGIYGFFGLTFFSFYLLNQLGLDLNLVNKFFYIWVSFFSIFHISVFWSFMSDIFNKEQAKRLFAIIAAGASLGALLGPILPTFFADSLGGTNASLIASILIVLIIPIVIQLDRLKQVQLKNDNLQANKDIFNIGGNPFAGFKAFISNPYLLGIGCFILLYTMVSTFIYFEQTDILREFDRAQRRQILGSIDLLVNLLTFGVAFFATGRITKRFGVGTTLASIPVIAAVGMFILAFAPLITVLLAVQVARRAGNYAVTRPAREMLFTEVSQEDRYKAKPVIDVVAYRGGDTVTAWFFTGLTEGLGLGLAVVGIIGAVIAAIWAVIGFKLGKNYEGRQK